MPESHSEDATIVAPPPPGETSGAGPGGRQKDSRPGMLRSAADPRWFGVYALIVLVVFFSIRFNITFFSLANFQAILSNEAVGIILALALLIPLVVGQYDLSFASTLTLSLITVTGLFQQHAAPVWLAVVGGVLVGAVVGAVNGFSIVYLRVNSLISTLATGSIALGVAQWWTNGRIFSGGMPAGFSDFGNSFLWIIPMSALIAGVLALVAWFVLERMSLGRYLYAIGDNPTAARTIGLPVGGLTFGAMVIGGCLAGLAGVVAAAKFGSGNPTIGPGYLLPAFSAVFLGSTIFRLGRYNVVGTIVAVLLLAVLLSGLTQFGLPFYISPLLTGVALLGAVAVTLGRHLRKVNS